MTSFWIPGAGRPDINILVQAATYCFRQSVPDVYGGDDNQQNFALCSLRIASAPNLGIGIYLAHELMLGPMNVDYHRDFGK